jgi:cyanophycinase
VTAPRSGRARAGRLMVIGGNEDMDERDMRILPRIVELAGGATARIVVCTVPTESGEETARSYREVFRRIGVGEVRDIQVDARPEADTEKHIAAVDRADAVLFPGGDQLRLTSLLAGTRLGERIAKRLFEDRLVVAGTSAGAAAMGSVMIVAGPDEGSVRRADVSLAPGLGYWRDAVVDTHFNDRGRISRLLTVLAQNPQVLGVGLDEDTAVEMEPGRRLVALGKGAVMIFDGRVSHSSAAEAGEDEILAATDAVVHVLAPGYGFDLRTLRPLLPDGSPVSR